MLTNTQLDFMTACLKQAALVIRQTDREACLPVLQGMESIGAELPQAFPDTDLGHYDENLMVAWAETHLLLLEFAANLDAKPLLDETGQALSFARRVLLVQSLDGCLTRTYTLIRQRPAESQLILPGTTPLPHADAPVIAAGAVASAPASSAHSAPAAG